MGRVSGGCLIPAEEFFPCVLNGQENSRRGHAERSFRMVAGNLAERSEHSVILFALLLDLLDDRSVAGASTSAILCLGVQKCIP
jgi:hypothetical protein